MRCAVKVGFGSGIVEVWKGMCPKVCERKGDVLLEMR